MSDSCIIISDDEDDDLQTAGTSSQSDRSFGNDFGEYSSWLRRRKETKLGSRPAWPSSSPLKRKLSGSQEERAAKVAKPPQSHDIRSFLSQPKKPTPALSDEELPDLDRPATSKRLAGNDGASSAVFNSSRFDGPATSKCMDKDGSGSPVFHSSRFSARRNRLSLSWRKRESQTQADGVVTKSPGLTRRDVESNYNAQKATEDRTKIGVKPTSSTQGASALTNSHQDGGVHVIAETSSEDEESQPLCEPLVMSPEITNTSKPTAPLNVPSLGPARSILRNSTDCDGDDLLQDEVNLLPVSAESDLDDDIPILDLPTSNNCSPAASKNNNSGSETQDLSKDLEGSDTEDETQALEDADRPPAAEAEDKGDEDGDVPQDADDSGEGTQDLSKEEFFVDEPTSCSSPKLEGKPESTHAANSPHIPKSNRISRANSNEDSASRLDFSQLMIDLDQTRSKLAPIVDKVNSKYFESSNSRRRTQTDSEDEKTRSKYFQSAYETPKKDQTHADKPQKCDLAILRQAHSDSSDEDESLISPKSRRSQRAKTKMSQKESHTILDKRKAVVKLMDVIKTGQWTSESDVSRVAEAATHDDKQKDVVKAVDGAKTDQWHSESGVKSVNEKAERAAVEEAHDDMDISRSPSSVEKDDHNDTVITIESNDLFSGDESPMIDDSDDEEFRMTMTQNQSSRTPRKMIAGPYADCVTEEPCEPDLQNHEADSAKDIAQNVAIDDARIGINETAKVSAEEKELNRGEQQVKGCAKIGASETVEISYKETKQSDALGIKPSFVVKKENEEKVISKDPRNKAEHENVDAEEDLDNYNALENFTLMEDDIVCLDDSDDDMFANLTQVDVAGRHDDKDQELPGDLDDAWNEEEDDVILIEDELDYDPVTFDLKKVKTEMESSWWDEDIFSQQIDSDTDQDDLLRDINLSQEAIVIQPNDMFMSQQPMADLHGDDDAMDVDIKPNILLENDQTFDNERSRELQENISDKPLENKVDGSEVESDNMEPGSVSNMTLTMPRLILNRCASSSKENEELPDLTVGNKRLHELEKKDKSKSLEKDGEQTEESDEEETRSTSDLYKPTKTPKLIQNKFAPNLTRLRPSLDLGSSEESAEECGDVYDMMGPSFVIPPKRLSKGTPKSPYFDKSSGSSGSQRLSQSTLTRKGSPSQKLAMLALKKAKESPKSKKPSLMSKPSTSKSSPKSKPSSRKTIMLSPVKNDRFYGKKSSGERPLSKFIEKKSLPVPEFEITSWLSKSKVETSRPVAQPKKTSSASSWHPKAGNEKKKTVVHLGKARKVNAGGKKRVEESFSLTQAIGKARAAMASRDEKIKKDDESVEKNRVETSAESDSKSKRLEHHKKSSTHRDDKSRERKDTSGKSTSKSSSRSSSSKENSDKSSKGKSSRSSESASKSSSKTSKHSSSSSSSRSSSRSSSKDSDKSHRSGDSTDKISDKSSSKFSNDSKERTGVSKERDKTASDTEKSRTKSKSDAKESRSSSRSCQSHSKSSHEKSGSSNSSRSTDSNSRHQSSRSDKDVQKSKESKSSKDRSKDNRKTGVKPRHEMSFLSQIIHDQDSLMTTDPEMEKHPVAPKKTEVPKSSPSAEKVAATKEGAKESSASDIPQGTAPVSSDANKFIKSLQASIKSKAIPPAPSSSSTTPRVVGSDGFAVPLPPGPRAPGQGSSRPPGQGSFRAPIHGPLAQPPSHGQPPYGRQIGMTDVTNIRRTPGNASVPKDRQVTSISLTEDAILRMILSWNPSWLQEQVKFGAKSKPPPLLEVVKCQELYGNQPPTLFPLLTHGYESLRDYFKIMLPLMLHEVWAQMFNEFLEKTQRRGGLPSFQAILCQALDRNEHVCEVMFQAIITEQQVRERKRPMEATLVIIKLFNVSNENSSQSHLQLLALATRVERSQRAHPVLAQNPKSKEPGASIWNIALKFAPRKHIKFEDNQTVILECLDSLVTTHRHIKALLNLNQIPSNLCRAFLRPIADRKAFFHQAPPAFKTQLAKGQYNASQSMVISAVASAILEPYIIPKICLIQGPPGTGKSHTILGIIKETLRGIPAEGGKVHILLTAPSNAAVDELVKKLVKDDEKAIRAGNQRRVNFIRMGTQSHPAVQEYSLEKKAQRLGEEKFRQQNLPLSIQEELKKLEGSLQDLALRKRVAVQAGRSSEVINCEREERNTKKKKDQIQAAYQTSGKKQLTHSEKKEIEMQLLMNSDVICTTLNSCGLRILMELNNKRPRYPFFNAVIVDEACQSTEVDNLIPLQFKCTKLVLVGDPRQLPATVISKVAENLDYNQSLFERLEKSFTSERPVMMLDTQYRMHPDICHFPSQHIYEGRLKTDLITASQREGVPYVPYKVFDLVDGQEMSSDFGFWNPTELEFVCTLCSFLMKGKPEGYMQAIGIITPYKAQSTKLLRALRDRRMTIEAATVDGFQGREKDIIIVTCVRAKSDTGGIGFLSDVRRMNVALTRARYACYVVGHLQSLKVNRDWRHLIADAEQRKMVAKVTRSADVPQLLQQEIMKRK